MGNVVGDLKSAYRYWVLLSGPLGYLPRIRAKISFGEIKISDKKQCHGKKNRGHGFKCWCHFKIAKSVGLHNELLRNLC